LKPRKPTTGRSKLHSRKHSPFFTTVKPKKANLFPITTLLLGDFLTYAIIVFWKVVFEKLFFKIFYVCLLLEKLVNGKHFPVNGKFGLVSRKVFSFLAVFVFRKVVSGKSLSKFSRVCLPLEKLVNEKHFSVKENFGLVFRKVFSWKIWAENTFRKLW